jgi:hypothetical protein
MMAIVGTAKCGGSSVELPVRCGAGSKRPRIRATPTIISGTIRKRWRLRRGQVLTCDIFNATRVYASSCESPNGIGMRAVTADSDQTSSRHLNLTHDERVGSDF